MEILGVLLVIIIVVAFLKLLGLIFHVGLWAIALPFKILGAVVLSFIAIAVFIPIGIFGALASIIMIPFALIIPLAPFLLVGLGIWLIVRKNG